MREIKFKFWLGHIKKMTHSHRISEVGKIIPEFTNDITPLQYTGLKDKNGKEIYEGDVLVIKIALFYGDEDKFKGVVGFQDGTFCLERIDQPERAKKQGYVERVRLWNDGEHDHYSLEIIETFEMEVIGNVHENQELIKL